MKKILIAGATGYLGQYLIKEAKRQGYWIRALTRDESKLNHLSDYIDELFVGEVTSPNSLSGVCKDIVFVISAVGITRQRDGLTYLEVDYQGNKNLLNEAKRGKISKFAYVSVFNADKMKTLKAVQAKLKFENDLKKSELNFTIIRPNGFFSDMLEYMKMARNGRGYLFGSGDQKINPIHGEDVARACLDAVDSSDHVIDVGGPDVFSHNDIINMAFDVYAKKAKVMRIPCWMGRSIIALMRMSTPVRFYGPLEFFISALTTDMVAPLYGNHHLRKYFVENIREDNSISQSR